MIECVLNVSEGRDAGRIELLARSAGADLLDLHVDPDHNRSVLTLVGDDAPRAVTAAAVLTLDLGTHRGVHPRIGVVDVVPFVPLGSAPMDAARAARDRFAAWAGSELDLPCFLYGPERSLPDVRRTAWADLAPDHGPTAPHPTAGACAVGVRPVLVAYNLFLETDDVEVARGIARDLRGPAVRALGMPVGGVAQVSMNLIDPERVGPADVYDAVAARTPIRRAELVGLVPQRVLRNTPSARWEELDLAADRTIEARLEAAGLKAT